jgi:hypothetical protein
LTVVVAAAAAAVVVVVAVVAVVVVVVVAAAAAVAAVAVTLPHLLRLQLARPVLEHGSQHTHCRRELLNELCRVGDGHERRGPEEVCNSRQRHTDMEGQRSHNAIDDTIRKHPRRLCTAPELRVASAGLRLIDTTFDLRLSERP